MSSVDMKTMIGLTVFVLSITACGGPTMSMPDGGEADLGPNADLGPRNTTPPPINGMEELVVSLTFDDTFADQMSFAAPLLDGIPSTFFVNSPRIGTKGY